MEQLVSRAGALGLRLIANLRTGLLWETRPPIDSLLAVLDGDEVAQPPPCEWDVGHYVELLQLLRGRPGALVLVRDSYPTLGWGGVHAQPPAALAAALERGDGREGGVLAVGSRAQVAAMADVPAELGLGTRIWDN